MAYLPRFHGDEVPGLTRIDEVPTPTPAVDLWLAVHNDDRTVRRVRVIIDAIAKAVSGHPNR
jgi:DNA-binding transcriptional LysR family regulator